MTFKKIYPTRIMVIFLYYYIGVLQKYIPLLYGIFDILTNVFNIIHTFQYM